MDNVFVICIAIIAAAVGFIVGLIVGVGPGESDTLTREERRRLSKLIERASTSTGYRSITLSDSTGVVDQVIIPGRWD